MISCSVLHCHHNRITCSYVEKPRFKFVDKKELETFASLIHYIHLAFSIYELVWACFFISAKDEPLLEQYGKFHGRRSHFVVRACEGLEMYSKKLEKSRHDINKALLAMRLI